MSAFQRPRKPRTRAPWTDSNDSRGRSRDLGPAKTKHHCRNILGTSAEWEPCPGDKWKGLTPDSCTKGMGTFTPDRAGPLWTPEGTMDVTSVGPRLSRGTCRILLSHGYESLCQRVAERSQGNKSRLYEEEIRSLAHRPWRGSGGGPAGCEASAGPASSPAAAPTPTPEERHRASLGAEHPGLRGHLSGPFSAEGMLPGPLRASRLPSSLHGPSPPCHPN